ncbi:MAG: hypothetical protein LBT22_01130 [Peptococcaceae bacterium]|nr:hypothetical protein [Peptococcaceae bacterium]
MADNEFIDLKILKMIDQAELPNPDSRDNKTEIAPENRTIYSGIKVGGKWFEFEARTLAGDKITMMIPKEFKELDAELAKIKYPMEQRPQTILTDASGTINLLLNHMDGQMSNDDAAMIRDKLFAMMSRLNPGVKQQAKGEETLADKNVAYVEFTNPALDGKIYNLMFFLELEAKPLMVSFNCLTKSMKYWQKSAFEMMRSLQILPGTEL